MARFSILMPMMALPKPMAIGEAETAAEAVRIARSFAAQGKSGLKIGDAQSEIYYPLEEFAAKHGVR